jgi:hypothetical protein
MTAGPKAGASVARRKKKKSLAIKLVAAVFNATFATRRGALRKRGPAEVGGSLAPSQTNQAAFSEFSFEFF